MRTRKLLNITYNPHQVVNGEPCQGDCYAYDDVLSIKDTGWTMQELQVGVQHLLQMHAQVCGNSHLRLAVGLDEARSVFIGTFGHYGAADLVTASNLTDVLVGLHEVIDTYVSSDLGSAQLTALPGLGRSACAYGEDQALTAWMYRAGGLAVVPQSPAQDICT